MKIGMIVEGSLDGADEKVYNYLARQLRADINVEALALGSKPRLIEHCGVAAKALLEVNRCEAVIVIWDHYPAWRRRGEKPCIVEDCGLIRDSLSEADLTSQQLQCVHLICIKHELETFLLADKQAIKRYLTSIKDRPCRINLRHPETYTDPKDPLNNLFYQHIHRGYKGWLDAEEIIKLANIDELWRCSSFERFADKVAGVRRHVL